MTDGGRSTPTWASDVDSRYCRFPGLDGTAYSPYRTGTFAMAAFYAFRQRRPFTRTTRVYPTPNGRMQFSFRVTLVSGRLGLYNHTTTTTYAHLPHTHTTPHYLTFTCSLPSLRCRTSSRVLPMVIRRTPSPGYGTRHRAVSLFHLNRFTGRVTPTDWTLVPLTVTHYGHVVLKFNGALLNAVHHEITVG